MPQMQITLLGYSKTMTDDYSFQYQYICGHKTPLVAGIKLLTIENLIDEYLYCETCNDFQKVIRLIIVSSSTLNEIIAVDEENFERD